MNRFALPLALSSFALWIACSGTETDTPIVNNGDGGADFASPSEPAPPRIPSPCPAPPEDELGPPRGLPRGLLLQLPEQRQVLAQGEYAGLEVWDLTDPGNPTRLSRSAVHGDIHQLLSAGGTELWVAASEPPVLDETQIPLPDDLDPALHVVRLDVGDPAAPVRRAEATLANDFWQMQQRGDTLWVLTGRLVPKQRGCDAPRPPNVCSHRYEAIEVHGLRPNGSRLDTVASAELPLGVRAWWATDGIATLTEDGTLHVLRWDGNGALRAPLEVAFPRGPLAPDDLPGKGPVEILGNQLLWVSSSDGGTTLYRFDLDGDVTRPTSSHDLGQADAGGFSLFWQSKLWLNSDGNYAEAQLWDLSGATPERIALSQAFYRILPLPDAVLDGPSALPLAVGWANDSTQADFDVLTLDGANVSLARGLGEPKISPTTSMLAPVELHGTGSAPAWRLLLRGPGLPMGLDPSTNPDTESPWLRSFVGIVSDSGELRAEATLLETWSAAPRFEIRTATATTSFDVPEGSDGLLPIQNGVAVLANEAASPCIASDGCAQSITLIDVSGTPRLVRSLPLPTPDVGAHWDPSRMYLNWSTYDSSTGLDVGPQVLDPDHVAFVADVDLNCYNQADCDALGIRPVPNNEAFAQLWGESRRQYVYVLQIAGSGAPRWQMLGGSSVESASRNPRELPYFKAPRALGGTMAVTRVERALPSGEALPEAQVRFVLNRFRLSPRGNPQVLAAVNIPGFPVAYLGADAQDEYWVSADPLAGGTRQARLHRLRIGATGAESEKQLDLEGAFAGLWPLQVGSELRGIALGNPENGCGVTQLSALAFGGPSAGGALEVSSQLDLPSDDWQLIGTDGPRVLLRRDRSYALVEVDETGILRLAALEASPERLGSGQLLGTTLRASMGSEPLTIEF